MKKGEGGEEAGASPHLLHLGKPPSATATTSPTATSTHKSLLPSHTHTSTHPATHPPTQEESEKSSTESHARTHTHARTHPRTRTGGIRRVFYRVRTAPQAQMPPRIRLCLQVLVCEALRF